MITQSTYKKINAHIQAPTHLDSSCWTKFTPGTNFRSIGQVCQMLQNTVTQNTANSHTSGISLEISLGIHHKGPDLSLNSITPLSICEMQPGWIWSFLLWLVDETMWETFPENWEGFTPALQPPRLSTDTRYFAVYLWIEAAARNERHGSEHLSDTWDRRDNSRARNQAVRGGPGRVAPRRVPLRGSAPPPRPAGLCAPRGRAATLRTGGRPCGRCARRSLGCEKHLLQPATDFHGRFLNKRRSAQV